ncbi:MAG: hypothetical protein CMH57_15950 [Myxococcales bacterium]|nr:hypothetical protein [Myxococcales bacterium]
MTKRSIGFLAVLMFLVGGGALGCSGDEGGGGGDGGLLSSNGGAEDTGAVEDTGATTAEDSGAADSGAEDTAEPDTAEPDAPPEVDFCEAAGLTPTTLKEATEGFGYLDVAGDFTVNTLDGGAWTLSEEWTGCESYVFLNYFQDLRSNPGGTWYVDLLWDSDIAEFLSESPDNVHYFFTSFQETAAEREQQLTEMKRRFDAYLALNVDDVEVRASWQRRLHFVTDRSTEIEGSVGAFMADYLNYMFSEDAIVDLGDRGQAQPPLPLVFAIDREQHWDPGGSLSEFVGGSDKFVMASYLGRFFNHKAALREQVAAETDVTTVTLLDEEVTERVFTQTITLPDGAEMAAFDTLEFDIEVTCPHRNPFACSEWDRIARIAYCLDGAECTDRREVVRWITPYWRRGTRRWLIDASPFLAYMREGGEQSFYVEMGPGWERKTSRLARMELRFATRDQPRAIRVERVFTGGAFNAEYNDSKEPVEIEVGDASRVELAVILSGHGQEAGNCAEWCDHRHVFTVDGAGVARIESEPGIGEGRTCARAADRGVSPGQWGNWAPGRAYWCPGMPVDVMRFELTDRLREDRPSILRYSANFAGNDPVGGSIALNAYVIWYDE